MTQSRTRYATPPRRWLTLTEAAEYAQVSTKTFRRWIAEGKVSAYRAGRGIRIDADELEQQLFQPIPTTAG